MAAVGLAAPEGAGLGVQDNAHEGVSVLDEPGGHGCGAVVDAHVLPSRPQRCEPEDGLVVAPPLRAPRQGLRAVGGTLPDHRNEVLDEPIETRVLKPGRPLLLRVGDPAVKQASGGRLTG